MTKNFTHKLFLLLIITIVFLSAFMLPPKSIYSIQFKDVDDSLVNMANYRLKKVMFITLASEEDTALFNQLSAFYSRHKHKVAIICVLSTEDGFTTDKKAKVKKHLSNTEVLEMVLTEGMQTRKAAKSAQSELMQWLTHKEHNLHFDMEAKGPGHKFFVDEKGELYAVIGPEAPLTAPIVERIMSKPLTKNVPNKPQVDSASFRNPK